MSASGSGQGPPPGDLPKVEVWRDPIDPNFHRDVLQHQQHGGAGVLRPAARDRDRGRLGLPGRRPRPESNKNKKKKKESKKKSKKEDRKKRRNNKNKKGGDDQEDHEEETRVVCTELTGELRLLLRGLPSERGVRCVFSRAEHQTVRNEGKNKKDKKRGYHDVSFDPTSGMVPGDVFAAAGPSAGPTASAFQSGWRLVKGGRRRNRDDGGGAKDVGGAGRRIRPKDIFNFPLGNLDREGKEELRQELVAMRSLGLPLGFRRHAYSLGRDDRLEIKCRRHWRDERHRNRQRRIKLAKGRLYDKMRREFEEFWSENGERIVLAKWREKYGDLIDEEENTQREFEAGGEENVDFSDCRAAVESYVRRVLRPRLEAERLARGPRSKKLKRDLTREQDKSPQANPDADSATAKRAPDETISDADTTDVASAPPVDKLGLNCWASAAAGPTGAGWGGGGGEASAVVVLAGAQAPSTSKWNAESSADEKQSKTLSDEGSITSHLPPGRRRPPPAADGEAVGYSRWSAAASNSTRADFLEACEEWNSEVDGASGTKEGSEVCDRPASSAHSNDHLAGNLDRLDLAASSPADADGGIADAEAGLQDWGGQWGGGGKGSSGGNVYSGGGETATTASTASTASTSRRKSSSSSEEDKLPDRSEGGGDGEEGEEGDVFEPADQEQQQQPLHPWSSTAKNMGAKWLDMSHTIDEDCDAGGGGDAAANSPDADDADCDNWQQVWDRVRSRTLAVCTKEFFSARKALATRAEGISLTEEDDEVFLGELFEGSAFGGVAVDEDCDQEVEPMGDRSRGDDWNEEGRKRWEDRLAGRGMAAALDRLNEEEEIEMEVGCFEDCEEEEMHSCLEAVRERTGMGFSVKMDGKGNGGNFRAAAFSSVVGLEAERTKQEATAKVSTPPSSDFLAHVASRIEADVVVDATAGGGDDGGEAATLLTTTSNMVVAFVRDPSQLEAAVKRAQELKVQDFVEFVLCGDPLAAFQSDVMMRRGAVDCVFVNASKLQKSCEMVPLVRAALTVTPNVAVAFSGGDASAVALGKLASLADPADVVEFERNVRRSSTSSEKKEGGGGENSTEIEIGVAVYFGELATKD